VLIHHSATTCCDHQHPGGSCLQPNYTRCRHAVTYTQSTRRQHAAAATDASSPLPPCADAAAATLRARCCDCAADTTVSCDCCVVAACQPASSSPQLLSADASISDAGPLACAVVAAQCSLARHRQSPAETVSHSPQQQCHRSTCRYWSLSPAAVQCLSTAAARHSQQVPRLSPAAEVAAPCSATYKHQQ